MNGNIVEVNEGNFAVEVEQAAQPVFVDFWAPWCGPCKALAPLFDQLAQAYGGQIKFAKVNADDNKALVQRLQVRGLPTLLLFRGGQVVERTSGAQSKAHFTNLLDRHVSQPVAVAAAAARPARVLRAFYADAALRDAVVERVRGLIEADRIVSYGGAGPVCDAERGQYSLMGAAVPTADVERFVGTLGIAAPAARLAEVVHSLLMQEVEIGGEKQYHLRAPASAYPLDWLRAIPLGADLQHVVPRFIAWFLRDLVEGTYLFGVVADEAARVAARQVAHLHERQATGNAPTADAWKAVRSEAGAMATRARDAGADLFSRVVTTAAEMLAWPVDELDDALAGALGTVFYALWQRAIRQAYSPAQWAEREAVAAAARARQEASPDAGAQELEAFEEVRAYRELSLRCQATDHAQGLAAKREYGSRLHEGLMRALAEATRTVEA